MRRTSAKHDLPPATSAYSRVRCTILLLAGQLLAGGCSRDPLSEQQPGDMVPRARASTETAAPGPFFFSERARDTGLEFTHFNGMTGNYFLPEIIGAGAAFLDVDRDGDLDVFLVQGRSLEPDNVPGVPTDVPADALKKPTARVQDRLFRNELVETGQLRFVDITEEAGLQSDGYGMGVAVADYDGDGWSDIYVTNLGSNQLWRNRGDGTFEDVTRSSGADDPRWSVPAVFFDYDGDDALDLFIGNYVDFNQGTHTVCFTGSGVPDYCSPKSFRSEPDRLLRNLGDGTFADVTHLTGLSSEFGSALGAVAADLNDDGLLDLYVANDWTPNQMWMNVGGSFENRALIAGTALNDKGVAEAGMGVDAGDFDNDGDEDLFVTHLVGETNTLYQNQGDGFFTDASLQTRLGGPSLPMTGFGTGWFDYDNDGWLDVLVVNGAVRRIGTKTTAGERFPFGQPNQLFRNLGLGVFEEVTQQAGPAFAELETSRGAAFGDVDNDGDTDVLIVNNSGPARLLLNELGQDRAWIGVRLLLPEGERDAIGSVVRIVLSDGRSLYRRARSSMSYASSSDPRILVGLGEASEVEDVTVLWLGGTEESFGPLETRRYHQLRRSDGTPVL